MNHSLALVPPSDDVGDRDPRVQQHRAQFGLANGFGVPEAYHRPLARYDWAAGLYHDPFVSYAALPGVPQGYNEWSGEHLVGAAPYAGLPGVPCDYADWSGQHLTGGPAYLPHGTDSTLDQYGEAAAFGYSRNPLNPYWMHDFVGADMAALNGFPPGYAQWSGQHLTGAAPYAGLPGYPKHYSEWCGQPHVTGAALSGYPQAYADWSGESLVGRGGGGGGHGGFHGHGGAGWHRGGWGGWGPWGWDNADYPVPIYVPVPVPVDAGFFGYGDDGGES